MLVEQVWPGSETRAQRYDARFTQRINRRLFVWISKLNDRTRILTQQLAILCERVNRELDAAEPRQTSPES